MSADQEVPQHPTFRPCRTSATSRDVKYAAACVRTKKCSLGEDSFLYMDTLKSGSRKSFSSLVTQFCGQRTAKSPNTAKAQRSDIPAAMMTTCSPA
jgi:hypothetical protein